MIHTISNDSLKVSINQIGAELHSIEHFSSETEFMWNGDPEFWTGRAPVLFPIVGALKDSTYIYQGKSYSLPQHGFARNNKNFSVKNKVADKISFSLVHNEDTLKSYPFEFELVISFVIDKNSLSVVHEVFNTGTSEMLFSIGAHPAFKCPLKEDENYNDYFLEFETIEHAERWKLTGNGLIDDKTEKLFDNTNKLALHKKLFDKGAIVLKNLKSNSISLVNKQKGKMVKVSFKDFNIMGIWAKPNAPFVCIEPWLGIADSINSNQQLEEKEGIIKLEAKNSYKATYSIEILSED